MVEKFVSISFGRDWVFPVLGMCKGIALSHGGWEKGKETEVDASEEARLREWAERRRPIAELYIEAALSLDPGFKPQAINLGYAENNLPYLIRDWLERDTLNRVFNPFVFRWPEEPEEPEVSLGEDEGEDEEYDMTPQVAALMSYVVPEEEEPVALRQAPDSPEEAPDPPEEELELKAPLRW